MNIIEIIKSSIHLSKVFLFLLTFSLPALSYAELEELEDKILEEQTGKEGITIDLSYKLSIGEIAFDFKDREQNYNNRDKVIAPPPPRIEYHQGKN
tara:strand:- start:262 stop:549 length:288 start_codon:yes stop_codon:yes gene_type:complete